MTNPCNNSKVNLSATAKITAPLKKVILTGASDYSYDVMDIQMSARSELLKLRQQQVNLIAENLRQYHLSLSREP